MKVKICGITNVPDALAAVHAGAWAVGFNFYQKSPRAITYQKANDIIAKLPKGTLKIGIFIEESSEEIIEIMIALGLDLAQVYQNYDEPSQLKQKRILCLQLDTLENCPPQHILDQYAYILIDAPCNAENGAYGGTGQTANWEIAKKVAQHNRLILAGGLNPANVHHAIAVVKPVGIDVASGIEILPGKKDHKLIENFFRQVKHAK